MSANSEKDLMELIKSTDRRTWGVAKHRASDMLLDQFDSENNRNFIWSMYVLTGDYYYNSILKNVKKLPSL